MKGRKAVVPIGSVFGNWTTTDEPYTASQDGYYRVQCLCICGTARDVKLTRLLAGKSKSCGCLKGRLKENNPAWKGGRIDAGHGYVKVLAREHPRLQGRTGRYVLEHILVMEEHLGRYLLPGENVHHKNGVRDDNRIENLELWSVSQPSGQRVEDKTAWAIDWLKQYKPEVMK